MKAQQKDEWRRSYCQRVLNDAQWDTVIDSCREQGMREDFLRLEFLQKKSTAALNAIGVNALPEGCTETTAWLLRASIPAPHVSNNPEVIKETQLESCRSPYDVKTTTSSDFEAIPETLNDRQE